MKTILIIDEVGQASIYNPVSYSDFIDLNDSVRLLLITNAASENDKKLCPKVIEIPHPTSNGILELIAFDLHKEFQIDEIYTKQEDLILRASYLRKAFGIHIGLQPDEALLFRDKAAMKSHLTRNGIKAPAFDRVFSPANIISFIERHHYPIIIKPTLGSASACIIVIYNQDQLEKFLELEFYDRIDEKGKTMDYSGDMIVEKFIEGGKMYHINGFAMDGKITMLWPFQYISSNLGFTRGKSYGNISISKDDELYIPLANETQRILDNLPCPSRLVFHLEVFVHDHDILLCEIAARRPGGSIALLIDDLLGGFNIFPTFEFRWNIGLPIKLSQLENNGVRVGDIMIPLQMGQLVSVPKDPSVQSDEKIQFSIIQISKNGTLYTGFDINKINTCIRIKCKANQKSFAETLEALEECAHSAEKEIRYTPIGGVSF